MSRGAFEATLWMIAALNAVFAFELLVLSFRQEWALLGWQHPPGTVALRSESGARGPLGPLALLVVCSALLPIAGGPQVRAVLCAALCLATVTLFHLQRYGQEGSDHVRLYANFILLGSVLMEFVDPTLARTAFLSALAALGVAFYFGAGWVKIQSPQWRSGEAVTAAFSTRLFGHARFAAFLAPHRAIAASIAWIVMVWELSFGPAVIFAGHYIVIWLVLGGIFHASVAVLMRLPVFLLASLMLYPAIFWVATEAAPAWRCLAGY